MSKNLSEIYQGSVPLLDAAIECVPERYRPGILSALDGGSYFSPSTSEEEKQKLAAHDGRRRVFSSLPVIGRLFERSGELDARAAFVLADELQVAAQYDGAIVLGYETPRRASDTPVELPLDALDGDIDWDRGTVTHGSISFEGVRVLLVQDIGPDDQANDPEPNDRADDQIRAGRPGYAQWLNLSARKLLRDDQISRVTADDQNMVKIREAAVTDVREMLAKMERLTPAQVRKKLVSKLEETRKSEHFPSTRGR